MKPLVVLHQRSSQLLSPLLTATVGHKLPLHAYAAEVGSGLVAALAGLVPLGFAGAVLEDPQLRLDALKLVGALEPEAREAGRVDLVVPEGTRLRGYFLEGVALANLLHRYAFGDRVLWLGPLRPELSGGLRSVARVALVAPSFPEGDAFMARIPSPQRGDVVVGLERAEPLARHSDLILYTGGALPLELLQPYHTLLALQPVPKEPYRLVGQYIGPEELQRFHLSVILEALGFALPPDAFAVS